MDHSLLCTWLGLPVDRWPPDHYTLLGLEAGDADLDRIQEHVHERHEKLRRYQLTYPDQVTEGMNRLAQAFDCLTNPTSKQAYDAALLPADAAPAPATPAPAESLGWLFGPWNQTTPSTEPDRPPAEPAGRTGLSLATLQMLDAEADSASGETEIVEPFIPELLPDPDDPVAVTARSAAARRGLGTKGALLLRISQTRKLLAAWKQTGKILGDAEEILTRRSEAAELVRQLGIIRQLLHGFPPLLGQAGQPGYSVIALARQHAILQTFQSLSSSQREVLAQHWKAGRDLLLAHRSFLREELRVLRHKSRGGRALRTIIYVLYEYPVSWLLPLALLALNLSSPAWRAAWPVQVLVLVAIGVIFAAIKMNPPSGKSWLDRTGPKTGR